MLTPNPAGGRPSPSEPTDFNGDGHVDVCTANILGDPNIIFADGFQSGDTSVWTQ